MPRHRRESPRRTGTRDKDQHEGKAFFREGTHATASCWIGHHLSCRDRVLLGAGGRSGDRQGDHGATETGTRSRSPKRFRYQSEGGRRKCAAQGARHVSGTAEIGPGDGPQRQRRQTRGQRPTNHSCHTEHRHGQDRSRRACCGSSRRRQSGQRLADWRAAFGGAQTPKRRRGIERLRPGDFREEGGGRAAWESFQRGTVTVGAGRGQADPGRP